MKTMARFAVGTAIAVLVAAVAVAQGWRCEAVVDSTDPTKGPCKQSGTSCSNLCGVGCSGTARTYSGKDVYAAYSPGPCKTVRTEFLDCYTDYNCSLGQIDNKVCNAGAGNVCQGPSPSYFQILWIAAESGGGFG